MDRRQLTWGGVALLLIVLAVWAINGRDPFDWQESYKIKDKQPYGLFAMHELLQNYTAPGAFRTLKDSVAGQLPDTATAQAANYVFVGEGMYMRPQDRDDLLAFVAAGNNAFIAAKVLPYDLMFYLYYDECAGQPWEGLVQLPDTVARVNFFHPALAAEKDYSFRYVRKFKAEMTYWDYFPDTYFCDMNGGFVPVGAFGDALINMVQVPYGSGYFYLHTQPQLFTNYFVVQPQGRSYTERALGHLGDGTVYWDEYSRVSERKANEQNELNGAPRRQLQSQSPLQYVLNQPPLAWGWYVLVALGVLYMLFRAKRRQRPIPVVHPPQNTSLKFVQSIGRLYYQRAGHQQLAIEAVRLLRTFVKERYGLQWRDNDAEFVENLSLRAGLPLTQVEELVRDARNMPTYSSLLESELIRFHQRLERFYQTAK